MLLVLMEALVYQRKSLGLILVYQRQSFCLNFASYLFGNRKEICKFKSNNKSFNFPNQLCLGSISNKFDYVKVIGVSLKGNVYDFSLDY